MIQANELRIGNLVSVEKTALHYAGENFKSALFEIEELKKEVVHFKGFHAGEYYKDLQPIPLSEEILLKCGFVLEDQMYKYFSHKDIPGIFQLFDGVAEYSIDSNDVCWVNNLHQLQNLFYSITGEELDIQI